MAALGLEPASVGDLARVHDLACRLISPEVAGTGVLAAVQRAAGDCAIFVRRDGRAVAGFVAIIPMSRAGLRAMDAGAFDPRAPGAEHICAPDAAAAVYGWGFAAATLPAAALALRGAQVLRDEVLPHLPFFARAATPRGLQVLTRRLGYAPYPRVAGVLWSAPPIALERAA